MFALTPDSLRRLHADTEIPEFDCGDVDLNEFLSVDAKHYLDQLLAVTYFVVDGEKIVAFNNKKTIDFYEKHGFSFLTASDEGEDTRQMYFDLKPFADLMVAEGYNPPYSTPIQ